MQRFISLRLLLKNHPTSNGPSYISNTYVSLAKTNLIYTKKAHASSVSQYSTTALSNSWVKVKPNKFFGFLAKPVLVNNVLHKSNDLLKAPRNGLLGFKRVFSRSCFLQKRSFSSSSSVKSQLSPVSHISTGCVVPNMLALYVFGTSIGRAFGPQFLLKLYLAGALGGSVCYLVYHAFIIPSKSKQMGGGSPSVPAMGASGALNAIMLLEILLNPKRIILVEMIIPVPALLAGVYLIGTDMLRVIKGDTRVSGSSHLGGAAVDVMAWLQYRKRRFY